MTAKKVKLEATETRTEAPAPKPVMTEAVASLAQTTVDHAQAAFEKASELAHGNVQMIDAAANAYKSCFADIQLKAMEFAQLNVNSGFAFARKLLALRDTSEVVSLQQDFLRSQADMLQKQAMELNELSVALARETLKPVQDSVTKSVASLSKTIAA
jgi:hypothetical protein